jgi:ribonuclease T2
MTSTNFRAAATATSALLAFILLGCQVSPSQTTTPANSSPADAQLPAKDTASTYDYYILNLSWSPEFCHTHPDNEQCPAHPGFVVHGLWPERNDGTYPENCPTRPGPTTDADWQGVIPTRDLAQHEWQTHGTCTPYDPDTYFGLIRKAWNSIKIPDTLTHTTQQTMQPPSDIIDAFARINTGLPAGSIVLSCGNNYLTAIEVCFDKSLNPRACSGLRTCRANTVKITPQTKSSE